MYSSGLQINIMFIGACKIKSSSDYIYVTPSGAYRMYLSNLHYAQFSIIQRYIKMFPIIIPFFLIWQII